MKTRIPLGKKAVKRIGFLFIFTSLCILCSNMIGIWILDDDLLTNHSFADILYTTCNLMGFFTLNLGLFALFVIHYKYLGKFGYASFILATLGTMLYAGDAWFEAFVIPYLSDEMPQLKDIDPGISLMIGIVITFHNIQHRLDDCGGKYIQSRINSKMDFIIDNNRWNFRFQSTYATKLRPVSFSGWCNGLMDLTE